MEPVFGGKFPVAAVTNNGKHVVSDDSSAAVTLVAIDALVALRWGLAVVTLVFAFLFYLFWRIKDLKSKKTILKGCGLGWFLVSILIPILAPENIYIIIFPIIMIIISIISAYSLNQEIKEEKYKLTEKEIYLLQRLAGKKK